MTDFHADERLERLLEELGPADPPAGFVAQVMARLERETRGGTQPIVRIHTEGIAMRKAMWAVAAAAAVLLIVFIARGFPPVGHGTDGTIGAAKKYQAAQLTDSDVVLKDAEVQEFLQSDDFDRLVKDPDARRLLSDVTMRTALSNRGFADALRDQGIRIAIRSELVMKIFSDAEARTALEAALKSNVSGVELAKDAHVSLAAREMISKALGDSLINKAIHNAAVRTYLSDPSVRAGLARQNIAAALDSAVFANALGHNGFAQSLNSNQLQSALAH
jgi:hypothetical protein